MKQMKKLVLACLVSLFTLSAFAQTTGGDRSVGVNLGYGFDSKNAILGLDYRYNFTDAFRLAPSLSYFVKKDNTSAFAIDMNAHYVVKVADMFGFYPLAGLDLAFWKHKTHAVNGDKASINKTRFGLNLGLGGELYATDELSIGVEIKYNIVKDYDQAILAFRVGYNF